MLSRSVSVVSRVGALLSLLLVASSLALGITAPANAAATLNIGPVKAQVQRLQNTETSADLCYRVGPSTNPKTATWSDWVSGGQEALAGHGSALSDPVTGWGGGCPDAASRIGQSTLGITPTTATSITEGAPFLLATFKHYNRALSSATGLINTGLNLEINGKRLYYKFTLKETPNDQNFCTWQTWGDVYCDDIVEFTDVTSTDTVTIDGGIYRLSFKGFSPAGADGVCSPDAGAVKNLWYTVENTVTTGCLYADFVRPTGNLTLAKTVVGGPDDASAFTLKAQSGNTLLEGKSGVTGKVGNGIYDLSESGPAGYKGAWSCTGGTMPSATSVIVPTDGNVTCTATNTWEMGTFKVALDVNPVGNTPVAYQNPSRTFAVSYSCTFNGTTTPGTLNLSKGQTSAAVQVPRGSNCSVDTGTPQRQAADFPDSSYTWVAPIKPAGITVSATEQTMNVVEQYTRGYGTFKVALDVKPVGNTPAAYTNAPRTFALDYMCSLDGKATASNTVNLADTKSTASIQVPLGSICTVDTTVPQRQAADFADSSYNWSAPSLPSSITVGANEQTLRVVEQYTRAYGTFKVALDVKPVGNTPAAYANAARTFAVNYTCELDGATTGTDTVNLADAKSTASIQVPLGSNCSVTTGTPQRQGADFADSSYNWSAPSLPSSITVGANEQTLRVVEQYTRGYGTFKVALDVKPLANTPAAYVNADRGFSVDYTCTLDGAMTGTDTVNLADGKSTASIQVPLGSSCAVTTGTPGRQIADFPESSYSWASPTLPGTVTVGGSEQTLRVVENYQRSYGDLTITKSITGPAASAVAPATGFRFDYNCGAGFTGSVSVTAGSPTTTIAGLPLHATCKVTESAAPSGSTGLPGWGTWTDAGSVTAGSATVERNTNTVTITNNTALVHGRVAVTKNVIGATDGLIAGSTFDVSIACTQPAGSPAADRTYQASLASGASWTTPAGELLAGATCSVSQTAAKDAQLVNATFTWGAKPANTTLVAPAGSIASTTLTDTIYERGRGVFAVNVKVEPKVASGVVVSGFTGTFRCSFDEGTRAVTTTGTWTAPALGGLATLRADGSVFNGNVPAGSTCSATENAPDQSALVDKSFAWKPFTIEGAVIVPEAQTATITAVNSTLRVPGSITLKKTASAINDLDGNGPDEGDTITYSFAVTNTSSFSVTEVTVTDPMFGTRTFPCSPSPLATGATADCGGATHTITSGDMTDRVVNNTATATAVPVHGGDQMTARDSTSTPVIPVPKAAAQPAKTIGLPPAGAQLPATGK